MARSGATCIHSGALARVYALQVSPPDLSGVKGIKLEGKSVGEAAQHGQRAPPLALPDLGSGAFRGCAQRLWAARHSQRERLAHSPPAAASGARASRVHVADSTARGHAGGEERRLRFPRRRGGQQVGEQGEAGQASSLDPNPNPNPSPTLALALTLALTLQAKQEQKLKAEAKSRKKNFFKK